MIVSHKLKLLFAHVPKTGGSSITEALRPWIHTNRVTNLKPGERGWQNQWHAIGSMHSPFGLEAKLAQDLIDSGYQVATSLRTPFERMASMWAIKGRANGVEPFSYLRKYLPTHCRFTVQEMAGPQIDFELSFETLAQSFSDMMLDLHVAYDPGDFPWENRQPNITPGGGSREIMERVYEDDRVTAWVLDTFEDEFDEWGFDDDPLAGLPEDPA